MLQNLTYNVTVFLSCVCVCVRSDEEPEQPSGLLAGGQGQHWAKDPQTARGAGEGDTGKQQTAGKKWGKWRWEERGEKKGEGNCKRRTEKIRVKIRGTGESSAKERLGEVGRNWKRRKPWRRERQGDTGKEWREVGLRMKGRGGYTPTNSRGVLTYVIIKKTWKYLNFRHHLHSLFCITSLCFRRNPMALTDQTWTRPVMQSIMQGRVFYEYHWRVAANSAQSK